MFTPKEEVKQFVRTAIVELLRMNEVEEAVEVEEAYQKLYPNSFAYFPDIAYIKLCFLIENGAYQDNSNENLRK